MKKKFEHLRILMACMALLLILDFFETTFEVFFGKVFDISLLFTGLLLLVLIHQLSKKTFNDTVDEATQYKKLIDLSPEPVLIHREGVILYANSAVAELLGFADCKMLVDVHVEEFIRADSFQKAQKREQGSELAVQHIPIKRKDGSFSELEIVSFPVEFNGASARKIIARDITSEKLKTAKLAEFAYKDDLTGLLNRRGLALKATELIQETKSSETLMGVLFLDLDGFKNVNDIYGHEKGDEVLTLVGQQLQQSVDENNILSRMGGDEFVVLVPNTSELELKQLSSEIIHRMNTHLPKFAKSIRVTPSIGIAICPEHGADWESLISRADTAMYRAKKGGKNQFHVYDHHIA